ncbi:hypothetical protein OIY81_1959 [Cryptosporidium canis]|uniref:Uncharacterized protein n=1 Tax=Cryptosporidium canis TaxID=195482 RepID=A0ABQ8PAT9_9CRYT|nr:hypothetical protein OIY81_1959 [Cryptosporidium canis]KAJ1614539.1 hypothetical protein OJ252_591 [Cryptosporidium canis]
MKKKSMPWRNYVYFCIQICNQLKKLEVEWKQPQSDVSLISWFVDNKANETGGIVETREIPTMEDYNLMITKAIEDGMLHVVGSYLDPIDGNTVRLLSVDKFFFPEIWL